MGALRTFFSPPDLGDPGLNQKAHMLSSYVNIILFTLPGFAVPIPFSDVPRAASFAILGGMAAMLIVCRILLRYGFIALLSWILVGMGYCGIVAFSISRGTIQATPTSGYVLVAVMAGLVLGMRGMLITLAASAVAITGAYALETKGLLPPPSSGSTLSDVATALFLTALAGVNVSWALQRMTSSLRLAREEADDRRVAEERLHDEMEQRARVEEQLLHAQKMEAVGRLAGGVAHDFNNVLTSILGLSELGMTDENTPPALRHDLEQIHAAGLQAADVTRQLLAFSRKQVLEPQVLDLNEVITSFMEMLERLIGEDIQLGTNLSVDLKPAFVDRGQLQQVVLNLAVNARDAMPDGGRLTIETANVEFDEAYAVAHADAAAGEYVQLAISDTGVGMTEEIKRTAFEPFVTTKGPGKGTGLGLATVQGIVKQSGGNINLYSEPGRGTTC